MKATFFAGCVLAISLLAPAISRADTFEVGALRVEQQGDHGTAIILIPGLASGPWVWRDTAARLAKDHRLYLLTLPGFDGRPALPGVTLESLQNDLAQLIASKRIDKPVLIGHSLGGTLSLVFAAGHSADLAGVIAVDGLPVFPGTEGMTGDRSSLAQRAHAQLDGLTAAQFAANQEGYMKQFGSVSETVAHELAQLSSRSDPAATADFAAQVFAADFRARMGSIEVPVVEISPFFAPDFAAMGVDEERKTTYYRQLLSGITHLEVVSISPARHFVMFDQPQKFAVALDRALAGM